MKGFLHIQCPRCGRARSIFAKEPITEFRCRCGNAVPLPARMTRAFVSCPSCEREDRYLTDSFEKSPLVWEIEFEKIRSRAEPKEKP